MTHVTDWIPVILFLAGLALRSPRTPPWLQKFVHHPLVPTSIITFGTAWYTVPSSLPLPWKIALIVLSAAVAFVLSLYLDRDEEEEEEEDSDSAPTKTTSR